MAEATLSLILKAKDLASKEIAGLNKEVKGLAKEGLGSLNIGFLAAAGGAGVLVGGLVDAFQGAVKQEEAMNRLTTALKANVPGWTGSTDAIEAATKAGIKLGFTDDDQTDSLTKLVVATHSVNKAIDAEHTAMDLARLKGISLGDATDALTKVEAGQFRALKAMGIVLKDGATQQDALNAVEAAAAGQAEAYAQTVSGKLNVAQAEFGDVMDRLGERILPVVADALDMVAGAMDNLSGTGGADTGGFVGVNAQSYELGVKLGLIKEGLDKVGVAARDTDGHIGGMDATTRAMTKHIPGAVDGLHDLRTGLSLTGAAALDVVNGMLAIRREEDYLAGVGHAPRSGYVQNPSSHNPKPKGRKHKHHAAGGWVGLDGPELSWLGEEGPEYVVPNRQAMARPTSGVTLEGVTEKQILDMVDRGLYFRLRRSGIA